MYTRRRSGWQSRMDGVAGVGSTSGTRTGTEFTKLSVRLRKVILCWYKFFDFFKNLYSGHFGWYFGDFQALRCIGGQWGAAGCSREQELLIRKLKILLRCSFFLWAASLCRFACSSRLQRLRGKNLHRKISKKSTIDLLEVKLQYEMQNIFSATKIFENFPKFLKNSEISFENWKIKFSKNFEFSKFLIFSKISKKNPSFSEISKIFENFRKIFENFSIFFFEIYLRS